MLPPESAQEWSCQYVLTILNLLGNFCVPPKSIVRYDYYSVYYSTITQTTQGSFPQDGACEAGGLGTLDGFIIP
jgi:hypothetical protein